jgi:hypothetical protein
MFKRILRELRDHSPFTLLGACTGIAIMVVFQNIPSAAAYKIYYTFHPLHVLLSAMVAASMYRLHTPGKASVLKLLIIGYAGAIGTCTLSDAIIPYLGEALMDLPQRQWHIGFIEEWWLVNPLAFMGILLAMYKPTTKLPHSGHILVSTWASLFHIIMSLGGSVGLSTYAAILFVLFLAVWLPCCTSDIVFPLLFVKEKK